MRRCPSVSIATVLQIAYTSVSRQRGRGRLLAVRRPVPIIRAGEPHDAMRSNPIPGSVAAPITRVLGFSTCFAGAGPPLPKPDRA
ncbi:hypothetical protein G7Z17_g5073 [Cylindrodendrum hubeiense]|uniref:Uncharacterized protein n=1 Tax=Cylindrodendrum hubeiense TaxID=595255 RepID=A0A9P5H7R5_9HYPO|nr:hypothetical protein G7Z17_g5073 [Cylindrodendrum hubeiense]